MQKISLLRVLRLLWLTTVLALIALALFPPANRMTRAGDLVLLFVVWSGLIALCWKRRILRVALLTVTLLAAVFLALPGRALPSSDTLRSEYAARMRRYEGVTYYWGGESPLGIDCSGLIRRGLIDSLFSRGVRTLNAGLVRQSLSLWWNDCPASALGAAQDGIAVPVTESRSINMLDHSKLLPGDLAVTKDGVHILAYLGENQWIQADPGAGRVLTTTIPSNDNSWFKTPVRIVRWRILFR